MTPEQASEKPSQCAHLLPAMDFQDSACRLAKALGEMKERGEFNNHWEIDQAAEAVRLCMRVIEVVIGLNESLIRGGEPF